MDGSHRSGVPRELVSRAAHGFLLASAVAGAVGLSACSAIPAVMAGTMGSKPDKAAAASAQPAVVSNFGELSLSEVTVQGLVSVGVTDVDGLVRWFNQPPAKVDPFRSPMVAEFDRADTSADTMDELKVSAVTLEALRELGVTQPREIRKVDRKRLDERPRPSDLCRNEIAREMQRVGWTVLRANVKNRPGATTLLLNDAPVGPIEQNETGAWRRFLVEAEGHPSDTRSLATLTVELPSPADGTPPVRWFKDIELVRGGEVMIEIDVAAAPVPSIGFGPKTPLSPAAVYAGDEVSLTCDADGDDVIWYGFVDAAELTAGNYRATPSQSDSSVGLPAWFRLRSNASGAASLRGSLLEQPAMRPIVLGRGKSLSWRPQFETPTARIGVLVRGASGFWGFAERSIAVADLRPGLWTVPVLPVDAEAMEVASRAAQAIDPSPTNIYATHAILDQLLYVAKVGAKFPLDMRLDEFRDASLPLASVTVDFGDGSAPVRLEGGALAGGRPEHAYSKEGVYRISVKSVDVMGFERTHGTNVAVRMDAPPPPPAPMAMPRTPSMAASPALRVTATATAAESSFDLFRRAAGQFARTVTARTARAIDGRKVGLAHIHDAKDQSLVDLMDGTLVSTMLGAGAKVYEREPVFQHAIEARGFVDASTTVVPEQGGRVPDAVVSGVAGGKEADPALVMELLAMIGTTPAPEVDVVLEYKLKRAEVSVVPAGAMVLRTARIFAWVRVHDRRTMQILFDDAVEISLGGTIAASEAGAAGKPWDSYPDGYLLRGKSVDTAIESIEVTVEKSVEVKAEAASDTVPDAATAPAATPAQSAPSVGGLLKGAFGG